MLEKYDIPFLYRQATLLLGEGENYIAYPSFSLPTYNGAVVEYIKEAESQIDMERKKQLYEQNHIPAVFLAHDNLKLPSWQQELYEKLEDIYQQPLLLEPTNK